MGPGRFKLKKKYTRAHHAFGHSSYLGTLPCSWLDWTHSLQEARHLQYLKMMGCFTTMISKSVTYNGPNVCVPSKFLCGHPNPQCDVMRRWGLPRRYPGHEGRALLSGISALINEIPESCLVPSCRGRTQWERRRLPRRRGPSSRPDCWRPDLGPPVSWAVRHEFLLFISHPIAQTKSLSQLLGPNRSEELSSYLI